MTSQSLFIALLDAVQYLLPRRLTVRLVIIVIVIVKRRRLIIPSLVLRFGFPQSFDDLFVARLAEDLFVQIAQFLLGKRIQINFGNALAVGLARLFDARSLLHGGLQGNSARFAQLNCSAVSAINHALCYTASRHTLGHAR